MATRYKLIPDSDLGAANAVIRLLDDGPKSCIPFEPKNRDYQEYLAWVAEGNTAEAAD